MSTQMKTVRLGKLPHVRNLTLLINGKDAVGAQVCIHNHHTTLPPREALPSQPPGKIANEGGFIGISYTTHKIFILGFNGDLELMY